jgi:hypothetical protein
MRLYPRNIRRTFSVRRILSVAVPLTCILAVAADAQRVSRSDGKPTSQVVVRYEELVSNGALLTPEGWEKAAALFKSATPYPACGEILIKSTGGSVGETWARDNKAEVQERWTDLFGTIDSTLRYRPPNRDASATIFIYRLAGVGQEWKFDATMNQRIATPEQALRYIGEMREKTMDPAVRANADKTSAALKKMKTRCRHSSGC